MEPIQTKGIELLDDKKRIIARKLFEDYYKKIKRQIKNPLSIRVSIKEYNKEGKIKKYSLNVETISSGKTFKANAYDWDLTTTIHQVFEKIITQIEHTFHSSDQ